MVLDERNGEKYGIDGWKFQDNDEVGFDSFLMPEEYLKAMKNIYHYEEDQPLVKDKIAFANIFGGTLLVGYGSKNMDNIYADFIAGERVIKLTNDIFHLFRKFEVFPMKNDFERLGISEERLYKNWGENFWRLKSD